MKETDWLHTFQLMKNPKWKKTHVKCNVIHGASLCRFVTEFTKGTTLEPIREEVPTCMDCRALMVELALSDNRIPMAIKLAIDNYVKFAHTHEKYHKEKK
jgi:hypothetical protein